ncbi:MAG: VWA domain-containing protein [Bacteroidota bacterium]
MYDPNTTFANPEFLWALAIIPLLAFWYIRRHKKNTSDVRYSTLLPFAQAKPTMKERLRHLPFILRMIVIGLLIVGFARPRTTSRGENVYTEGIDIVLLFDISGSMLAEDLRPNRIEAARDVMMNFIEGRTNDRIGLVIFSGESFTQCPMTLDYRVLKNQLRTVKQGVIEDGTAIGMAIAQGVNRLKESKTKSKVMILLTDGVNNRGEIDPLTATQIAQTFGIRIYTIGVGTSKGEAPFPVQTPFGIRYQNMPVDVDEKTLTKIAEMTGGQYFRATNNRSLKQIYQDIDEMEKTRIEVRAYRSYTELFYDWVWVGLIALALEILLSNTYLRKLP